MTEQDSVTHVRPNRLLLLILAVPVLLFTGLFIVIWFNTLAKRAVTIDGESIILSITRSHDDIFANVQYENGGNASIRISDADWGANGRIEVDEINHTVRFIYGNTTWDYQLKK